MGCVGLRALLRRTRSRRARLHRLRLQLLLLFPPQVHVETDSGEADERSHQLGHEQVDVALTDGVGYPDAGLDEEHQIVVDRQYTIVAIAAGVDLLLRSRFL